MRIRNFYELGKTQARRDALSILEAGYNAIDTRTVLKKKITNDGSTLCLDGENYICAEYDRIFVIAIGKCALEGAEALEDILGDTITDGIVLDLRVGPLKKLRSYAGTHPYPSEINVSVSREVVKLLRGVTERDLVLVLISGGGSSLLCLPFDISCEALAELTKELTHKGVDIYELNTVRKHLSEIQGGHLARLAYPAHVVSLIFSDVPGNDISVIASGPTVLDESSADDARVVLTKYAIKGVERLSETPKDPKYFERVHNTLILTNHDALLAMKACAESRGYNSKVLTEDLRGEAREVGKKLAELALPYRACAIAGGETTVHIANDAGYGGRNMEVVLAALPHLDEHSVIIAAASDGWDNTDIAGAIGDKNFFTLAVDKNLDVRTHLRDNTSYNFFSALGAGIMTGRLGSNVSDLFIVLRV
ncbi:MAG: hypothetical protein UY68_C0015G0005 [Parcubacteria group bacterium GW2011_GWF2_52_12]|nr:MAG: hypothetical protein UY68_C0015G0005 [Parcubacteria group bacterium GW2011_GWF2_52_12]